jgi:hypothetical protein
MQPGHEREQRGLARPIRADQRHEAALRQNVRSMPSSDALGRRDPVLDGLTISMRIICASRGPAAGGRRARRRDSTTTPSAVPAWPSPCCSSVCPPTSTMMPAEGMATTKHAARPCAAAVDDALGKRGDQQAEEGDRADERGGDGDQQWHATMQQQPSHRSRFQPTTEAGRRIRARAPMTSSTWRARQARKPPATAVTRGGDRPAGRCARH